MPSKRKDIEPKKRAGAGYSRSRWNAMTHGLAADHIVLPGENPEALEKLREEYSQEWKPKGPTEERLVIEMADIDWKLERFSRAEQAFHRQEILLKYAEYVHPISTDSNAPNSMLISFQDSLVSKEPEAIFEQVFEEPLWEASPKTLEALKSSIRRLVRNKSTTYASLHKAINKLPLKFKRLWEMAVERPEAFDQFLRLHGLPIIHIKARDWSNFSEWAISFALPYIARSEGTHPVSRKYRNHVMALANLKAMEKLSGFSRYEVRLQNKRKETLAILLRLQGK